MEDSRLLTSLREAFQLTVTATGFATRTFSGTLYPGEIERLPPMALEVAAAITEVQVGSHGRRGRSGRKATAED